MSPEKKKKLRNIAILSLLSLLGGTFAFQAFNQQAINDRLRENQVEVGGRVHDYYNRDTENKDVFVENYGQEPIMARIRLSEFMEIQERGKVGFTPIAGGSRGDVSTWTTWKPSEDNLDDRVGDSDAFDQYSKLSFGWERNGQTAPWYLPTFNHDKESDVTAAAGHARDYLKDGATHPGNGEDKYWSQGQTYDNSAGDWEGSAVTRETAQHLPQAKEVMTIEEWVEVPNAEKIGNFWVVDHETGWAYWASQLQAGQATSYLLDAAEMTAAADEIPGSYYYGIHVESHLVGLKQKEEFINDGETHHDRVEDLLKGIYNNAIDEDWGFENPDYDEGASVDEFRFGLMNPGRTFTMEGEQFRYLENMQNGNHLIIRNNALRNVSWLEQEDRLASWYGQLHDDVQEIVAPVANSFTTGEVADANVTFTGSNRWRPNNLSGAVAADFTQVVQSGTPRAFALSLADVTRLSDVGLGFPSHGQRGSTALGWWWLRTPSINMQAWTVMTTGNLGGSVDRMHVGSTGGVRPALIIHQNVGN